MQPVTIDQIAGLDRYERIREDFRRRIIDLKKQRRIAVGEFITFVFENRDTVLFQIQEMVRAEHITDIDKLREEIDCYNELIPRPGELFATLLIEYADPAERDVERGGAAVFAVGHLKADRRP